MKDNQPDMDTIIRNSEWFFKTKFKEKQKLIEKIIKKRERENVDFIFGISMNVALMALFSLVSSGETQLKCFGVLMFTISLFSFLYIIKKYKKFKVDLFIVGDKINQNKKV